MPPIAFLFDVDNTLLDNDAVEAQIGAWIGRHVGEDARARYWSAYETVRGEHDYADYLGALQRCWSEDGHAPRWLSMGDFLLSYPYARHLYPGALESIARLSALGPTCLVSDGETVMQPRKLRRSGLWDAVQGRVMICLHKERSLAEIERRFPAQRYAMFDDKLRILEAMKSQWHDRLTTVFVRQGHYAHDPGYLAGRRAADRTLETIGEILHGDARRFGAHDDRIGGSPAGPGLEGEDPRR